MYLFSENLEEIPLSFGLDFYTIYSIYYNYLILYTVCIILFSTTYCIILYLNISNCISMSASTDRCKNTINVIYHPRLRFASRNISNSNNLSTSVI
nr:MAG TPA: hypothetical protein [Bacteriophage sp.]